MICFVCLFVFQSEDVKNSLEQAGETQAASEGRTRSVRSLGTAELIRPQKLKYFESMCCTANTFFLSSFFLLVLFYICKQLDK